MPENQLPSPLFIQFLGICSIGKQNKYIDTNSNSENSVIYRHKSCPRINLNYPNGDRGIKANIWLDFHFIYVCELWNSWLETTWTRPKTVLN